MPKRKSDTELCCRQLPHPSKRQRYGDRHNLLDLSDELILKCLSFLEVQDLLRCETICQKLRLLAKDNGLWRKHYYNTFIQPRARRIPAARRPKSTKAPDQSVDGREPVRGTETSPEPGVRWRGKYKLKHNWTNGQAQKSDIEIGPVAASPILARICGLYLITVDANAGLRVWRSGRVMSTHTLDVDLSVSALAVDSQSNKISIGVGFTDGSIIFFHYYQQHLSQFTRCKRTFGAITNLTISSPYVISLYASSTIEILELDKTSQGTNLSILSTLQSEAQLSPASLSLRRVESGLLAGIAYAFNRFNSGWCLGLQEVRIDLSGQVNSNRSTSTAGTPLRDTFKPPKPSKMTTRSAFTAPFAQHPQFMKPPNSLSYCGCYVLAGLPDNTLMVYNVVSTEDKFEVSMGRRLWGHTSAVSAAEVNSTGKALSISAKSDEMRYWELEDILSSSSLKKTSTTIEALARSMQSKSNSTCASQARMPDPDLMRKWVSFSEEQAVVLAESGQRQILSCYDFS